MPYFHWIYISSATRPMYEEDLVELLKVSRDRNEQNDLTGLLLFSRGRFMQVLEGKEWNVYEISQSIKRDNRHKDIITLRYEDKDHLDFTDWRMGFLFLDHATAKIRGFSRFLEPDYDTSEFRKSDSEAYRTLMEFRNAFNREPMLV